MAADAIALSPVKRKLRSPCHLSKSLLCFMTGAHEPFRGSKDAPRACYYLALSTIVQVVMWLAGIQTSCTT
eukprot:scaffold474450_cov20-Prasinocladus_malaysianus.AAC.2